MLLYKNVGTCTIFLEFKLLLSDVSKFQRKNLYQNQERVEEVLSYWCFKSTPNFKRFNMKYWNNMKIENDFRACHLIKP